MKFNVNQLIKSGLMMMAAVTALTSCNKDVPAVVPITAAPISSSTRTIADTVNNGSSFTILKAAITKASTSTASPSLAALLSDRTGVYTLFAPTDAAFQASGIASAAVINSAAFRAGQLDTLLRYHIVGGQNITSAQIPTTFPNLQLPSLFVLSAPSAALPPGLRMPIFPSRRANGAWVNNVPLTATDIQVGNGVVHTTATIVAPPTTTIKGLLASNLSKYSILLAAIQRADSGLVASAGTGRLDSAINFPPANLTVFAPNNDAFRALFPPGTPDANIIATLNNPAAFPAQNVRALIAYHLLGSRAFSVNFAAGPAPVNTQLALPTTPPTVVPVIVTYGGANFFVRGAKPGSSDITVITRDQHAINGVVHEIGQLLMFQ